MWFKKKKHATPDYINDILNSLANYPDSWRITWAHESRLSFTIKHDSGMGIFCYSSGSAEIQEPFIWTPAKTDSSLLHLACMKWYKKTKNEKKDPEWIKESIREIDKNSKIIESRLKDLERDLAFFGKDTVRNCEAISQMMEYHKLEPHTTPAKPEVTKLRKKK